jgi:hypothetical protein
MKHTPLLHITSELTCDARAKAWSLIFDYQQRNKTAERAPTPDGHDDTKESQIDGTPTANHT